MAQNSLRYSWSREEVDSKLIKETENNKIRVYKGYTVVDTSGYKKIKKLNQKKISLKVEFVPQLQVLQVFVFMLAELRLVFIYFHLE